MLQAEIFTEVDIQNSSVAETSIKNMNNSFSVSSKKLLFAPLTHYKYWCV